MSRPNSIRRYIALASAAVLPITVLSSVGGSTLGQQPTATQRRGEPMKELGPGDIDYAPPGVEQWHGAAPNGRWCSSGSCRSAAESSSQNP